jgi:hypothetical protein
MFLFFLLTSASCLLNNHLIFQGSLVRRPRGLGRLGRALEDSTKDAL